MADKQRNSSEKKTESASSASAAAVDLTRTGVFVDVPIEDYHAATHAIDKPGLDLIHQSPLHYWAHFLDPQRLPEQPAADRLLVSALAYLLGAGEKAFEKRYAILDADADLAGSAGSRILIDPAEWTRILRMHDDLVDHPVGEVLFQKGSAEDSFVARDPRTGLLRKARTNWRTATGSIVALYPCRDASLAAFRRAVATERLHVQAAFDADTVEAATKEKPPEFIFAAVEVEAPHACAFYILDGRATRDGRLEAERDFRTYAECMANKSWPGYPTELSPVGLSALG